jgi:hypothetical protein
MPVLEHSVAEFIERFKHHVLRTTLYPQTEASPMLEAKIGSQVVYLFDRTGPYSARHGAALVIVHPVAETVFATDAAETLTVTGVSGLEAVGEVIEIQPNFVVVRVRGVPLVVGTLDDSWRAVRVGNRVGFSSVDGVHGFYLKAL